jgi:hypothetical protein
MHVLPHALHLRWPIAAAPLVAAGVAAIWLGSAPSITDSIRPAGFAGSSSAAAPPVGAVPRRQSAPQPALAAGERQRFLRVMLLYGMGGRPLGFFK